MVTLFVPLVVFETMLGTLALMRQGTERGRKPRAGGHFFAGMDFTGNACYHLLTTVRTKRVKAFTASDRYNNTTTLQYSKKYTSKSNNSITTEVFVRGSDLR